MVKKKLVGDKETEVQKRSPLPRVIELDVQQNSYKDKVPVDRIRFLCMVRYIHELRIRNPEVLKAQYLVAHYNRWIIGETDEKMFSRLVRHLEVPVLYRWIDLADRTGYVFPFPDVPTPEQMDMYLEGYDFFNPPRQQLTDVVEEIGEELEL